MVCDISIDRLRTSADKGLLRIDRIHAIYRVGIARFTDKTFVILVSLSICAHACRSTSTAQVADRMIVERTFLSRVGNAAAVSCLVKAGGCVRRRFAGQKLP